MRKLWIHIGTPKTGSTAIQRYARSRQPYLASKSVDFLIRGRRGSYNDLGVHLRGGQRAEAEKTGAEIRRKIAGSPAETLVLTSEMFTGSDPALLREVLALDEPFETRIVGYFRRQDRYLESAYKQKMKTGKVKPGFQNYVDKFGTRGGEYRRIISGWDAAWPDAEFIFRRFDPAAFPKGDVVHDFTQLLGLDIDADDKPPVEEVANPTPSIDLLDLMQLVADMPGLDARKVFRSMPVGALPRFEGRAMDNATALALLSQFEEDNEALRQRFFPDDPALFPMDDLSGPDPAIAAPAFSDDQRAMIRALLQAVTEQTAR
ncbi:MAG: hypothetical protein RIA08_21020 [Roseovarius sp.]|uniref:hypothetical protein n=1 Tax=Roseovarius sp. TaxID=1486281 RepID=UPI0032EBEE1E